ncbi:hypothetical protein [Paucibacter sp. M5-1]|uniref:hypothetical protein n=1 Tax=Paucibacter sp. M5-1 TaxID=3015998 RepID=UPI0022B93B37|nr:hypothetical protein [Paucibacter sp. M5-1]MCZ7883538.1 hypothetical protein [Paucibacter sp. M5-1]
MQGLTLLALPGPQPLRLALGLCGGNRNIGLVWAGLGLGIHPVIALYFACSQLPIYTLPRLLQAWLRRQA